MADKPEPQEEAELKGTSLPAGDLNEWGAENRIVEPGLFNEQGQQIEREGDEEDEDDNKSTDKEVIEVEEAETPEVEAKYTDPGEYQPKDYSFNVTVYDKEGKNGRQVKVTSVDQWDKLIEDESNFGSAAALFKADRLATKMESASERDKVDYDNAKKSYDDEQEQLTGRQESLDQLVNEMQYLENRGDVPKIPAKFRDDWTTPDAKKDPAVKEQQALLTYMNKENAARIKAGLKPETSLVSAFNSYKLDKIEKEEADDNARSRATRRDAGARVRPSSSPATGNQAPKGIAVGRAGSLNDLSFNNW